MASSQRRFFGATALILLLASVAVAGPFGAAEQRGEEPVDEFSLERLPRPSAETFEESVREQLEALRGRVERTARTEPLSKEKLGEALGLLGSAYLLYDFMDAAETCLEWTRQLMPGDARWTYLLAVLDTYEGRFDGAVEELRATLEIVPDDVPALLRLGLLQLDAGDIDGAEASFERALELDPESSAAHYGLGRVGLERGDSAGAVAALERALQDQPEGSVVHFFLGQAYRRLKRSEDAARELALSEHREIEFKDPLFEALGVLNVSREAFFSRGVEAMRRGDPATALSAFEGALQAQPDDPEAHYNVGMALVELGNLTAAESHLRRAIELRDSYRDPQFNLGLMLARRGDYEEAEQRFRKVMDIDPVDPRAPLRLAGVLARTGRAGEALELVDTVIERDPAMAEAVSMRASILLDQGRAREAVSELERILTFAPGAVQERAEAHFILAGLAQAGSEGGGDQEASTARAIEHLEQAIELDPEHTEARSSLAGALARSRRFKDAARQFRELVVRDPNDDRARFGEAMALLLGEDYGEARARLEQAVDVRPQNLALRHALARLLATCPDTEMRDGGRALALAREVIGAELTVEHAETLAMALAETGDFDQAVEWQNRVLQQQQQGDGAQQPQSLARLRSYQAKQPVRAPWLLPGSTAEGP